MPETTRRVLAVEDDAATQELLRETLAGAGCELALESDGLAGLERIRRERFDLVLLDVHLPGMDGLEVLARVRELDSPPRVMVMTGDGTPETILRAIREQAYRYIAKPFSPRNLASLVREILAAETRAVAVEVVSAKPDWVELLVPCQVDVADRIVDFLQHLKSDLPEDIRLTVGQAFREMLLNAIEWGGQLDPNRKVRIAFLRLKRMLLYRIADPGQGFQLEDLEHAAVGHPEGPPFDHVAARERKGLRPGGFGILMARAMVDELVYNEARNEVILVKYLHDDSPEKT